MKSLRSHLSRISRIAAVILTLTSLIAGPPARSQTTATDRLAPATINDTLERLATVLAVTLDEPEVRIFLHRHLESAMGDVPLRSLLHEELTDGSTLAAKLANGYLRTPVSKKLAVDHGTAAEAIVSIFEQMPNVDLSAPVNFILWDPEHQAPLVSFIEEGIKDSARTTVRLFDAGGGMKLHSVDEVVELVLPVLVLEYHDGSLPPALESPLPVADLPHKVGPTCTTTTFYKSYPLISEAGCFDAHEGCCNGPDGFMYFTAAGTEKTGNLPSSLGGRSGWDTNVWGSNFQGPKPVFLFLPRWQWEWTSDGWWEYSHREYPAMFARQTKTSSSSLSVVDYTIKEDDEWPNGDDYVGKVRIDHGYCKTDVFDQGLSSGWSNLHTTPQIDDIKDVEYELYCSKSQSFTCSLICNSWGDRVTCTGSGSCSGCQAGPDWVQCNGGARFYCDELEE